MINVLTQVACSSVRYAVNSRTLAIGAGCLLAIPACEAGYRASEDVSALTQLKKIEAPDNKIAVVSLKYKLVDELISHVTMALFFGLSALNLFPGSAVLGGIAFLVYSKLNWKKENYDNWNNNRRQSQHVSHPVTAVFYTGLGLTLLLHYKKKIAVTLLHSISIGLKRSVHAISQLFKTIVSALKASSKAVVKFIAIPFKACAKGAKILLHISKVAARILFAHPLITAVVLTIAIGVTSGASALVSGASGVAYVVKAIFGKIIAPVALAGAKVVVAIVCLVPKVIMGIGSIVRAILHV